MGELLLYLDGHQPCKNGVAAVLRSRGKDAVKTILLRYAKIFGEDGLYGLPLVDTQVVQQNKESRGPFLHMRQHVRKWRC